MIITALDYKSAKDALSFVDEVDPKMTRVKIGKELFTRAGPDLIEKIQYKGFDVFLDLKFHDIPNTIRGSLEAATDLGVWMVNVHACGGPKMLSAARDAVSKYKGNNGTRLIGVTVLTSMDQRQLKSVGVSNSPEAQTSNLTRISLQEGLDGVVCSAQDVTRLRGLFGDYFLIVTPGIRTESISNDDQVRTMTALDAVSAGSNHLVIGRPITQAENPQEKLNEIYQKLRN